MNAAFRLTLVVITVVGVAVFGCSTGSEGCPTAAPVHGSDCSLDSRQCSYLAPQPAPCDGSEDCYCQNGKWLCNATCAVGDASPPIDAHTSDATADAPVDAVTSDSSADGADDAPAEGSTAGASE